MCTDRLPNGLQVKCDYETFKCGISNARTSEPKFKTTGANRSHHEKFGMCCSQGSNRPSGTQVTRSAPQSHLTIEPDSTNRTCCSGKTGFAVQKPQITSSCSSICMPQVVDKESSVNILTQCDLELIRRQFEEASRKLQEVISSQNRCHISQDFKKQHDCK